MPCVPVPIVVIERKTAFGQKPKFEFGERVQLSWQQSFLPMPIGLWAAHTSLRGGTEAGMDGFVRHGWAWPPGWLQGPPQASRCDGRASGGRRPRLWRGRGLEIPPGPSLTQPHKVMVLWCDRGSVRDRVRPRTHDKRSANAFGHFLTAFPNTYDANCEKRIAFHCE